MQAQRAPAYVSNCLRYNFQWEVCREATGTVLNIGCNEDPAGLRRAFPGKVVNCDLEAWDGHMNRPNAVDRVFNCLETPWPVDDLDVALVLFGDILEHFTVAAVQKVLRYAHEVAPMVAITVPEDIRIDPVAAAAEWEQGKYDLHTTIFDEDTLVGCLTYAGWEPVRFLKGDWGFAADGNGLLPNVAHEGIQGFCVLAS